VSGAAWPRPRPARVRFAEEDLARIFDSRTLKRGRTLVLADAVALRPEPAGIGAIVTDFGVSREVKVVPAQFGPRIVFTNSCSCTRPACAHMAAAALAMLDRDPAWRRAIQQSLFDVAPNLARPVSEPAAAGRVLFELEPGAEDRALFVSVSVEAEGALREKSSPRSLASPAASSAACSAERSSIVWG
jgi:hypothetical protein